MTTPKLSQTEAADLASSEWRPLIEPLAELATSLLPRMVEPRQPQLRHELYRTLVSQVSASYLAVSYTHLTLPTILRV